MSAREYVDTIAVPTVEDFRRDPSQRRGYLACLAVYHTADYLKPEGVRSPDKVRAEMQAEVGRPFLALWRMADAVKHREKTGKGGAVLMQAGADMARPGTGFGSGILGGSMNPGTGKPGNAMRFDDRGGRYVEDDGVFFDMLDLCLIALRGFARIYTVELAGSRIDGIRYNTADYPKT